MPYVHVPVPISDANNAQMPSAPNSNDNSTRMVWNIGGVIYAVCTTGTFPAPMTVNVFKSTDNGVSWVGLDMGGCANANTNNFGADFDGATTIRVCWAGSNLCIGAPAPAVVQDFDLVTETWGGATAGGPMAGYVHAGMFFTTGEYLIILGENNLTGHSEFWGCIFNGAFGVPVNMATNISAIYPGASVTGSEISIALDTTNNLIHTLFRWGTAIPSGSMVYQAIDSGGVLGAFSYWDALSPLGIFNVGTGDPATNQPGIAVFGNNIVIAFNQFSSLSVGMWVGAGILAPVWSVHTFDPGMRQCDGQPKIWIESGKMYISFTTPDSLGTVQNAVALVTGTNTVNPSVANGPSIRAFDGAHDGGVSWIPGSVNCPFVVIDTTGNPSFTCLAWSPSGFYIVFWLRFWVAIPTNRFIVPVPPVVLPDPRKRNCR